jgi:hypothetical protein
MSEPFDLMGWLDEPDDSEPQGGYICQFTVEPGHAVLFASGLGLRERFFSALGSEDSKGAARALKESYPDGRVQRVVELSMYADSVLNKEKPSWEMGYWPQHVVTWQDAFTEVFREPLERALDNGLVLGKKHWGRIRRVQDPYQQESQPDLDDDDKRWVPYIAELYGSKEEAMAAAGDAETVVDSRYPSEPEEWAVALEQGYGPWDKFCDSQVDLFKSTPNFPLAKLADDSIGLTEEVLSQLRAIALEDQIPF